MPDLVLVPGLGNNARLWADQCKALSVSHRIVVADYTGACTIAEMADRVMAQAPAEIFSLVGFSLGGYISLDLVDRAPHRLERLALISTSPYADSEQASRQRERLVQQARLDYRSLLESMAQFVVYPEGENAARAREVLVTMGEELGPEEFCRQQRATQLRADSREVLARISCPVRVLCGEDDRVTPVSGNRWLADHIPGAQLQVLNRAGHLLPLEKPAEVTSFLLQWLELPGQQAKVNEV